MSAEPTSADVAEAIARYGVQAGYGDIAGFLSGLTSERAANDEMRRLTGIPNFFRDAKELSAFLDVSADFARGAVLQTAREREWGDYQTPPELAERVCAHLREVGVDPEVVIEPTCGSGNFILAALGFFPRAELVYGVEIQKRYIWQVKARILEEALRRGRDWGEIELHAGNLFQHSFPSRVLRAENLLIIGNPPWITNAELGALGSANLPRKGNPKGLSGLDALTGKSNFDIAEAMMLRLIETFQHRQGVLAMLCKNSVIQSIVAALPRLRLSVSGLRALSIDAGREFGAGVEASVLIARLGAGASELTCELGRLEEPERAIRVFGWLGGKFVSDVNVYQTAAEFDGRFPFEWRQGVKHDCAKVMELRSVNGEWVNGYGDTADIEPKHVYPLLKGSDLGSFEVRETRRKVVVTQHYLDDETERLRESAPKLWSYLAQHAGQFERRKSSIYRGKARFSMFGVGAYSFLPFKVAISGLYKTPRFSLILPVEGQPVLLDDTCYFVGFQDYTDALLAASLLNTEQVRRLLGAVAFPASKRPYTKEVLMRIDLVRVIQTTPFVAIRNLWQSMGYVPAAAITSCDYEHYKERLQARIQSRDAQLGLLA